jgi:hypothetical protein
MTILKYLFFLILQFITISLFSQSIGDFRTKKSANWNSPDLWQRFDGTSWVDVTYFPSDTNGAITISNSTSVVLNIDINADELIINGTLTVDNDVIINIIDGAGDDIIVNDTLINYGKINVFGSIVNSGLITNYSFLYFDSASIYKHNFTTTPGNIPLSQWHKNSTCEIIGYTSNTITPTGLNQYFGNFIWNCINQNSDINLKGNLKNIYGNFSVLSTGSGKLILTNNNSLILNIYGNFNISDGKVDFSNGNYGSLNLNLYGSFIQSGGEFKNSNSSSNLNFTFKADSVFFLSNTGSFYAENINWLISDECYLKLKSNIVIESGKNITINGILEADTFHILVNNYSSVININGMLKTANKFGFSGNSDATIDTSKSPLINLGNNSTIYFNSDSSQIINFRNDYANIIIDNAVAEKKINGNILISKNLLINNNCILNNNGYNIFLKGNLINNGIHKGNGRIVVFNGSSVHTLQGSGNFGNIEMNDINYNINLTSDINIDSTLTLTNGNLNIENNLLKLNKPISGNLSNLKSTNYSSIEINGNADSIIMPPSVQNLYNLTINNVNGIFIQSDINIYNSLNLSAGSIKLGNHNLILKEDAIITGAYNDSTMIDVSKGGYVIKQFNNGNAAGISFLFPVGNDYKYTPLSLSFISGSFNIASISVSTKAQKHIKNYSNTDYIKRYWDIISYGINSFSCNILANYSDSDICGIESNIYGGLLNGNSWIKLNQASSNQISGTINNFSSITGIDGKSPEILNLTIPNTPMKVGDTVTATITVVDDRGDFPQLSGGSIGGYNLYSLKKNNDSTYTAKFIIYEGGNDYKASENIPLTNLVLTDAAGNSSAAFNYSINQDNDAIDANSPKIINISISNTPMKIGDTIIAIITVADDKDDYYSILSGKIAGFTLFNLIKISNTIYSAKFIITEGIENIPVNESISVENIVLTDIAGNISNSFSSSIVQDNDPIYRIRPSAIITGSNEICSNQSTNIIIFLTGIPPWNLTITSNGFNNKTFNNINSAYFTFSVDSGGSYKIINLIDNTGNYGINLGDSAYIVVKSLPKPFFNIQSNVNFNDPPISLTASHTNGTFSGNGISVSSGIYKFYPSIAGEGQHIITLSVDSNGCSNNFTKTVNVGLPEGNILDLPLLACYDAAPFIITGVNPDTSIIKGHFSIDSDTGILNIGNNRAVFYPALAGSGTHIVTYSYSKDSVLYKIEKSITVDSIGEMTDIIGLKDKYCTDDEAVIINAINLYPAGGTGEYYGVSAPALVYDKNLNRAIFTPSLIFQTQIYDTIYYQYTSLGGCKSKIIKKAFIVYPTPDVNFNLASSYNKSTEHVQLSGVPSGGDFLGLATTKDGIFRPKELPANSVIEVKYLYTDSISGCANSKTKSTIILEADAQIFASKNVYCYYDNPDTITGMYASGKGTESIGFIPFKGLDSISKDKAIFYPSIAGNGDHTITYRYLGLDSNIFQISKIIKVDSLGKVSIENISSGFCADKDVVTITSKINGINTNKGLFSGNTIINNGDGTALFFPKTAKPGTHEITYTYTDEYGCISTVADTIIVHNLPQLSFNLKSLYNRDENGFELFEKCNPVPKGGLFYISAANSDFTLKSYFNPDDSSYLNNNIIVKYTYTDSNGCANSLLHNTTVQQATGIIQGTDFDNIYCNYQMPDTLFVLAISNKKPNSSGVFSGQGILNIGNDKALFDPSNLIAGKHTIKYSYVGFDNVTIFDLYKTIEIDSLVDTDFNLVNDTNMCINSQPIELISISKPYDKNGYFSGPENSVNNKSNGTAILFPDKLKIGINYVSFTYIKEKSKCSSSVTKRIIIHPAPEVGFAIDKSCIQQETKFIDTSKVNYMNDYISKREWFFGDGSPIDTHRVAKHTFNDVGDKFISLKLETNFGCKSELLKTIKYTIQPKAKISWYNECYGNDPVQFIDSSKYVDEYTKYFWNFGDGQFSNIKNPEHTYNEAKAFAVSLNITASNGCSDSVKDSIFIRPMIDFKTVPYYFTDFENGDDGWKSGGINSSWQYGIPKGKIIKPESPNDKVWITSLSGNYENNEKSYVIGPCFNLSSLKKPMLKMKININTKPDDGAVIQYTTDDGKSWINLGNIGEGIGWYNSSYIEGRPGNQNKGWSFEDSVWHDVRINLDELLKDAEKKRLRFRIAFGSNSNDRSEGIAFDDIWIGDRSKIVLLEHFTNASNFYSNSINNTINSICSNNKNDVIDIQYHSNLIGNDPLYFANSADILLRQFYYNLSSIPYTFMDGNIAFNYSNSFISSHDVLNESLKDPLFDINCSAYINDKSTINVNVIIKALKNIEKQNISCYVAIVEDSVILKNSPLETKLFKNVFRKILPDANGFNLYTSLNKYETKQFNTSWKIENINNLLNLKLIVFVQNNITKEIYQSFELQNSSLILNNIPYLKDNNDDFKIFPNPAKDEVIITCKDEINQEVKVKIISTSGQLVQEKYIDKFPYKLFLNELNGIYFLYFYVESECFIHKLVIIK